jgi:hypothetical protein
LQLRSLLVALARGLLDRPFRPHGSAGVGKQINMQFDGVATIDDISDVDGDALPIEHNASAFGDRCPKLDLKQFSSDRIRATDDNSLIRVPHPNAL